MAYKPDIPQATDQLNISQGDILGNFQALGAIAGNANNSSASINGTAGFNWLYLPPQGAKPPAGSSFAAGNVALYSANNNAGNTATNKNELFINKQDQATVVQIPATASSLSIVSAPAQGTPGWTLLPSGLIIQWGLGTANGLSGAITYPITFPNQVLATIVCTAYNSVADGDGFVRLNTQSQASFTVYASARTTVTNKNVAFNFMAIGY